ncbi:filamentous hemagglutinin family protein [Bradyrhizobium sp. BRP22]|uniref:filamentous hemagglutinin family protein n=1 Tax=Bradyrhizobium sp. BRP22 TaxID=2793821 RepID=UPI00201C4C50|nr:filamentous hemagglutinin family protein [Bradyrhizobium sp. BRP22]MCA1454208.1 filamentous hemagglutinin family protein [Bradyrhizobium sp. BRP22]
MTTFGGDILAWFAEGGIDAGRGAKTTVLYTRLGASTTSTVLWRSHRWRRAQAPALPH